MRVVRLEREFRALVVTTVFLTGFNHQLSNAVAQTSAFSYQGRLSQNGSPATGLYDLRFTLYDAASNGTAIGGPLTNSAVGASNGLFTVLLDFGSATFNGSDRWLQVAVRTNGSPGAYTALTPLQPITSTPYALRAANAATATLANNVTTGAITSAVLPDLSTQYVRTLNGNATNSISWSAGMARYTTNLNGYLVEDYHLGSGGLTLMFSRNPFDAEYGKINIWTTHNGNPPSGRNTEIVIASGWNMAFGVPGHIQFGVGTGNYWSYWQNQTEFGVPAGTLATLGHSGAQTWRSSGVVGGAEIDYFPGILGRFTDTTGPYGLYELDIFADLGNGTGPGGNFVDAWSPGTLRHGIQLYAGNKFGVRLNGGLMLERSSTSTGSNSVQLDFSSTAMRDITVVATTVTLSTRGWQSGGTNIEPRIFYLRGGGNTTLIYPTGGTGWNTNGTPLPSNVAAGQMVRLALEATGPGETNIQVVSAQVLTDHTFFWDVDALDFISRAGITDPVEKKALNDLAENAKGHGWWTNCDVIYPFVGGNAAAHSRNLKSSSYSITWHGSLTHDANGITGNGLNAYGDPAFNLSSDAVAYKQDSGHLFVYCGSTVPIDAGHFLSGYISRGVRRASLYRDTSSLTSAGLNNADVGTFILGTSSDWRGPSIVIRNSSTAGAIGLRALWAPGSTSASTGVPGLAPGILSRLDEGKNADHFSNANLRGASIGGAMDQTQWNAFRADWDAFNEPLGRKAP